MKFITAFLLFGIVGYAMGCFSFGEVFTTILKLPKAPKECAELTKQIDSSAKKITTYYTKKICTSDCKITFVS